MSNTVNDADRTNFESVYEKGQSLIEQFNSDFPNETKSFQEFIQGGLHCLRSKIKPGDEPTREKMAEAAGVDDFIRRLWVVRNNPLLKELVPHIPLLLNNENISPLIKNDPKQNETHDKLFELYTALLLLPLCEKIDLDHPDKSGKKSGGKKRPDIKATIDGRLWSFECKAISSNTSTRAKAYIQLLEKAFEQLSKEPTTYNITVFGFKNQIQLDEIWPMENNSPKVWETKEEPFGKLVYIAKEIHTTFVKDEDFTTGFYQTMSRYNSGGILVPATLNIIMGTTSYRDNTKTPIAVLKEIQLWPFGQLDPQIQIMAQRITDQLHYLGGG
jgi:hypothetical protein